MAICGYLWMAFAILWVLWALRTKPTQSREGLASRISYSILVLGAYFLIFSRATPGQWLRISIIPNAPWLQLLGVLVTVAGLGFAVWARAYLGGNWSGTVTVKVGHELVRTGPYQWVRHPIYTGLVSAMLGTALCQRQLRGFLAVVLLYIGFYWKSKIEEGTMTNTFGAEYAEYSRNTGGILPKL